MSLTSTPIKPSFPGKSSGEYQNRFAFAAHVDDESAARIVHDRPHEPAALRTGRSHDCDDFFIRHDASLMALPSLLGHSIQDGLDEPLPARIQRAPPTMWKFYGSCVRVERAQEARRAIAQPLAACFNIQSHHDTAAGLNRLSRYPAGLLTHEKRDDLRDVLRPAQSLER